MSVGEIISGEKFNELYADQIFCKGLTENLIHNGMKLKEGLNKSTIPIASEKAMFFCEVINLHKHTGNKKKVSYVEIPNNAQICINETYFTCDCLILTKIMNIDELDPVLDDYLCMEFIKTDINNLSLIRSHTENLCGFALKQSLESILLFDDYIFTKKFLEYMVSYSGWSLRFIPKYLQTEHICDIAIHNKPESIYYVVDKTYHLCELAVSLDGMLLYHVPRQLRLYSMCHIAVSQNGMALQYVPEELRTSSIVEASVDSNGISLQFVPLYLRTSDLCEIAVKNNINAIKFVPKSQITSNINKLIRTKN